MIYREGKRIPVVARECEFFISGATEIQIRRLEMRGRAERVIRRAMQDSGASLDEIESFLSENLLPIWDVVRTSKPQEPPL